MAQKRMWYMDSNNIWHKGTNCYLFKGFRPQKKTIGGMRPNSWGRVCPLGAKCPGKDPKGQK